MLWSVIRQASSCPEGGARYCCVLTLLAVLTVLRDFAAAGDCVGNYVLNSQAKSGLNDWIASQPQSNSSGTAVVNEHFQIATMGTETSNGGKGQLKQNFQTLRNASIVTISASMKRDKIVREGSPLIQAQVFDSTGRLIKILASTDLQASGNNISWATYSASFSLPSTVDEMSIYLMPSPRTAGQRPSANVAYFDDICVQFATFQASISPSSSTVVEGDSLTLTCSVTGTDKASFTWSYPNSLSLISRSTIVNSATSSKFIIFHTSTGDEGVFTCFAVSGAMSASASFTLAFDVLPKFRSVSSPTRAIVGQDLRLPCAATGKPFPSVTWYKNKQKIESDNVKYYVDSNALSLTIKNLNSSEDSGLYVCFVQNRAGRIQKTYNLSLGGGGGGSVVPETPSASPPLIPTTTAASTVTQKTDLGTTVVFRTPAPTASSTTTSSPGFFDMVVGGLKVYIWMAIGGGVLLLIIIAIIACCASCCKRRAKEKRHQQMSVHYMKASRKGASYAIGDHARTVGAAHHPNIHPRPAYPSTDPRYSGYYPESGYNSNAGTMERGGFVPTPSGLYPAGPRYSQAQFPQDSRRLISPRQSMSAEMSPEEGHINEALYEELGPVQEEAYIEMHAAQPEAYIEMHPARRPVNVSSLEESNLDLKKRQSGPALPDRHSQLAAQVETPKRASAEIPDTPGDIDYKI